MILESQEKYLASRPDKSIITKPFDPKAQETGKEIVKKLEAVLPGLKIYFWGATAIGIAGQNDIDIDIFSTPKEYDLYRPVIEGIFGQPIKLGSSIRWEFKRNDFDVELFLTDKNSPFVLEQLKVFQLLSQSQELRDEYQKLKLPYGQHDFKSYMRKKYEFFNKILDLTDET